MRLFFFCIFASDNKSRQMKTYPLTFAQAEIYYAWAQHKESVAYNLPQVLPYPTSVDPERLRQAVIEIWKTRKVLRIRLCTDKSGHPSQFEGSMPKMPVTICQMTEQEAVSYINNGFVRPFKIDAGEPIARFEILCTESHNYLLFDIHHLISDGYTLSSLLVGNDIPHAYNGFPLTDGDYGLYDVAQKESLSIESKAYADAKQYFHLHFQGLDFTEITAAGLGSPGRRIMECQNIGKEQVDTWCHKNAISPNLLMMGAFAVVLSRMSGEEKVTFATLNHGRSDRRLKNAYGMFVKSVPVVAEASPELSVKLFFSILRKWMMGTIRHAAYPFHHLCRDLRKYPAATFAFQSMQIIEKASLEGVTVNTWQPVCGTAPNKLSCIVYAKDGHYEIRTESSEKLMSRQLLKMIATAVAHCTQSLMDKENGVLDEVSITTAEERQHLISLGQGEQLEVGQSHTFVSLFLQQAGKTPDAVAVVDKQGHLTYNELNRRSAALAEKLIKQGLQKAEFVAITAGQRKEFLVAALAVQRAGGAYVPLAPEWPEERQQMIFSDAKIRFITDGKSEIQENTATSINLATSEDLAYMIYTSGTTGKPKGVMIQHKALTNFILSIVRLWKLSAESRICCHASVAFDASVEDIFPVLTQGGTVCFIPEEIRKDVRKVHQFILDHHITGGCFTTSFGVALAETGHLPMDYICIGGERLNRYPVSDNRIINTYGPTEFTVDATFSVLQHESKGTPPIGRPMPNNSVFILDHHGKLLPMGAVGELCLAGPQMAKGYWNQPELTQKFFTFNEELNLNIYHTGDLARWNVNGQLEYFGRADRQLKIRGFRVEPGEIERKMKEIHEIKEAVVSVSPIGKGTQLCAYFTAETKIDIEKLKLKLSQSLPDYMVPAFFCQLKSIPVNSSGKTDFKRLPSPIEAMKTKSSPRNEEEKIWCEIFANVLEIPQIGPDDDFFQMGGSSLLALSLQMEAEKKGKHLNYSDIFDYPTPRLLAEKTNQILTHQSRIQSYDDHGISLMLQSQQIAMDNTIKVREMGDILLTGATGFLGIHLLDELLKRREGTIHCVVRNKDGKSGTERLHEAFDHAFGKTEVKEWHSRVSVVEADVTTIGEADIPFPCQTIIHCAADVRHHAPASEILQTNINSTQRIIELAKAKQAQLIHISTISIAGTDCKPNFSEQDFDVGQQLDNDYIRSKFMSERMVLDAIANHQIRGKVMRMGNLTPSTGTKPVNVDTHGIHKVLEAIQMLKACPKEWEQLQIDATPVDFAARAVILLAEHESGFNVFHCFSPHTHTIRDWLENKKVRMMDWSSFQQMLNEALLSSEEHRQQLLPLVNLMAMAEKSQTLPQLPAQVHTSTILKQLNFKWK